MMATTDVDDAITYVFRWRTSRDEGVCSICGALDGQIIYYNLFAPILVSDTHGPVWDLDRDHSLAHGYHRYNCRCNLEVEVEVDWNRIGAFQELRETLNAQGIHFRLNVEVFRLSGSISAMRQKMEGFKGTLRNVRNETKETNNELSIYLALARRSGDENINRLISLFQRGRISAEMLIRSLQTLYAATGPWGWALGAGQFLLSAFMFSQTLGTETLREQHGSEGPQ